MKVLDIMMTENANKAGFCQQLAFLLPYGYLPINNKATVDGQKFTVGSQSWIDFIQQAEFDQILITVCAETFRVIFSYWPTQCGNYLYVTKIGFLFEDEAERDEMQDILLLLLNSLPDQSLFWMQSHLDTQIFMLMERPSFVDREYLLSGNAL